MTSAKLALLAVVMLPLAAACGSDDEPETTAAPAVSDDAAAATDAAPAGSDAPVATDAPDTTPVGTEAPTDTPSSADAPPAATDAPPAAAGAAVVGVELDEWTIVLDAPLAAGATDFSITNVGEFTHELAVIKGDSYDTLPQTSNGAVDEAALPAGALLAKSDKIEAGQSGTLAVEFEAGNYVLLCNIAVGPNSHAGAGQVLDITVG
jgi:hypothetical protein